MRWMSHGCLSKVCGSEIKTSLPIVTGKTTWCPASYKRIISLFPTPQKHCFCCGHIPAVSVSPRRGGVVQEVRAPGGLVSFCFSITLVAVFYLLLHGFCPDWRHLQCPRVSLTWHVTFKASFQSRLCHLQPCYPGPDWQVCLITSAKIISCKKLMTNILRVLSLSPFPHE